MIFRAIAKASLTLHFNPIVLGLTLAAIVAVFAVCWCTAILLHLPREIRAAFIQCSFHGNLGYIGLAVAFYYLGSEGLARASILAAFIMILQNLLAVVTLQAHSRQVAAGGRTRAFVAKIVGNPVIVSALVGIFFLPGRSSRAPGAGPQSANSEWAGPAHGPSDYRRIAFDEPYAKTAGGRCGRLLF